MISLLELKEKLKEESEVAIIAHCRPDGDAIGSCLGLSFLLRTQGIKSDLYCEDSIPEKFFFLSGVKDFRTSDFDKNYSAVIAVDCADVTRLGKYQENFIKAKRTYNIDHHISNDRYAKFNFVCDRAANAENIYDLIKEFSVTPDTACANALAMGVITDTGNFRHKNVTENTLSTAKELFSLGADFHTITYHTFTEQSKERALLFGKTMSKLRYLLDGKLVLAVMRLSDFDETKAKPEETEGFIDFIMGIKGVEVGICLMEMEKDKYKVSFRSQTADVNAAASMFGGGGHKLASGCRIAGEIEEVIDRLSFAVSRVIEE